MLRKRSFCHFQNNILFIFLSWNIIIALTEKREDFSVKRLFVNIEISLNNLPNKISHLRKKLKNEYHSCKFQKIPRKIIKPLQKYAIRVCNKKSHN